MPPTHLNLSIFAGYFCMLPCKANNPGKNQQSSDKKKRAKRLTFWVRRPPGGVGVFPRKGVVAEKFVPSLESLSSLGFEERNVGCPGNFAGMSRTPGNVQKVCAKKVRAHFALPKWARFTRSSCEMALGEKNYLRDKEEP